MHSPCPRDPFSTQRARQLTTPESPPGPQAPPELDPQLTAPPLTVPLLPAVLQPSWRASVLRPLHVPFALPELLASQGLPWLCAPKPHPLPPPPAALPPRSLLHLPPLHVSRASMPCLLLVCLVGTLPNSRHFSQFCSPAQPQQSAACSPWEALSRYPPKVWVNLEHPVGAAPTPCQAWGEALETKRQRCAGCREAQHLERWAEGQMDGWTDGGVYAGTDGGWWVHGGVKGWMEGGWVERWMGGWRKGGWRGEGKNE